MVFVILGTQDKTFERLLRYIDKNIELGVIKDKVVVQAGQTIYKSNNMEIYQLIPMNQFKSFIESCDYIITHGGVGSILDGLKANKKIIAVPRLARYKEHVNDHQVQIIDEFASKGYILACNDLDKLDDVIGKLDSFKPKKYKSNNANFVKLLTDYIDNL